MSNNRVKNAIHNPLIITGDYQVERFTNAIMIEAVGNCTITLPALDDTIIGYFLWIKRNDNNDFTVTISASPGNNIEGLSSVVLVNHQSMGVLGFNGTLWRYFSRDRFTVVTEADLSTISPTEIGMTVFNTNPAFMFGVGLYYANGSSWILAGIGDIDVLAPLTGDGLTTPITLQNGSARDIVQWQSTAWGFGNTTTANVAYVDTGGNNSDAQVNDPLKPFATIVAAKDAIVATGIAGTVYVRPGTHAVDANLIAANVSYYFSPKCSVACSVTPFSWSGPLLNEFCCYGYGEFSVNAGGANIISLTGNLTTFIFYAQNLSSSLGDAVTVSNITNCYIDVADTIQSAITNGMTLQDITQGIVYAGTIFGAVRGIDFPTTSTRWYINCFSIIATTSNAVRSQGVNNVFIDCVNITSILSIGISAVNGNFTIRARSLNSSSSFAIDQLDGTCTVNNFDTITGSTTSPAIRVRNNARMNLFGNTVTGISITGGTPILIANINRLLRASSIGNSCLLVSSTTGGSVNMLVNTVIGGGNSFIFRCNSGSSITMNIIANYVDTAGVSTVLRNAGSVVTYLKVGRLTSTNMVVFDIAGGTNIVEFDSAATITINVPVVNITGNSNNWFKGRFVSADVGNCLRFTSTSAGTTNWDVNQCLSISSTPFLFDITNSPTINVWNTYIRCTLDNAIGHVVTVTGAGTPRIRLFNCVGTKVNATAKIFSSTNPINVLVYSTFTTNDTSTNTTYQVGNNLVSALVT